MKDSTLLKISVICSVLGIMILYLMSSKEIVGEIQVSKLDESYLDHNVRIVGKITKLNNYEKTVYFDVSQQSTAKIVLFKKPDEEFNFTEGELVEIVGRVDENNGIQIIGSSVKKLG